LVIIFFREQIEQTRVSGDKELHRQMWRKEFVNYPLVVQYIIETGAVGWISGNRLRKHDLERKRRTRRAEAFHRRNVRPPLAHPEL
jgi:hypothetical protein